MIAKIGLVYMIILVFKSVYGELLSIDCSSIDPTCSCTYLDAYRLNLQCDNRNENAEIQDLNSIMIQINSLAYSTSLLIDIQWYVFNNLMDYSFPDNIYSLSLSNNQIKLVSNKTFANIINCLRIDLSSNELKDNVILNAPSLTYLNLALNRLTTLTHYMLQYLSSLNDLDVSYNDLVYIEPDAFNNLTKLSFLSLSNNEIKYLSDDMFINCQSLLVVVLRQNFIEEIKVRNFRGLNNTTNLDLSGNFIREIANDSFIYTRRLQSLYLNDQLISNLSEKAFRGLRLLKVLNLNSNLLDFIQASIFSYLPSLETLYITGNFISKSPDLAPVLGRLQVLYMSQNNLAYLAAGMFQNQTMLKEIRLVQNEINDIEADTFKNQSLSLISLFLSVNKLHVVKSHYFSLLQNLTTLDLSHNQISKIEKSSFIDLISLKTIFLSHNCLFYLDSSLFVSQTRLVKLDLSHNVLGRLNHPNLFSGLKELQELYLANNDIYYIHPDIFRYSSSLLELNICDNYLSDLTWLDTVGLANLKRLIISKNNLEFIEMTSFRQLIALKSLDLSHNRLKDISHVSSGLGLSSLEYLNLAYITPEIFFKIRLLNMSRNLIELNISYCENINIEWFFGSVMPSESLAKFEKLYLRGQDGSVTFLNRTPSLKTLDISENSCLDENKISTGISYLKQLRVLYLTNLNLELLDQINFSSCLDLSELYLSHNRIQVVRKDYFDSNMNLQTIYLNDNKIEYIESGTFSSLKMLFNLELSSNYLRYLEPLSNQFAIFNISSNCFNGSFPYDLTYVNEIDLSDNYFTNIDFLSTRVYYASKLRLDSNSISLIDNNSFLWVDSLSYLYLQRNVIEKIEPNSFIKLKLLNELDLSYNMLSSLDHSTFAGLGFLITLNLSYNRIEVIERDLLSSLSYLLKLDLRSNLLKRIEDWSFETLTKLRWLYLGNNSHLKVFTAQTFQGLQNEIKMIELDSVIPEDLNNMNLLKRFFQVRQVKSALGIEYYESIDLVYETNVFSDYDCTLSFYYVRNLLKLNLYTEEMTETFLSECQSFFGTLMARFSP